MARTHGHGNPKWSRDETILALDLYFECAGHIPSGEDVRVQRLSKVLRSLPCHDRASKKDSFRNPDGVAFKLQNLRQLATGKGLSNVSEMDRKVWSEFGSDPEKVKQLAGLIKGAVSLRELHQEVSDWKEEDEFYEGRVLTELHKTRERDPRIRDRLLKLRRGSGILSCDMCSAKAQSFDPALEDAAFEVHHLIPLSMTMERTIRLTEVALLCANCHRLLHRAIALEKCWLGIEEGQAIIGLSPE